jgi:hypothetical protein
MDDIGSTKLERGGAERIASWCCCRYLSARSMGAPWMSQRMMFESCESSDETEMGLVE